MAKGEIYRIEIPIIVNDQTDMPLKQAEQKINRFEKSALKANERIRRIFGREIRLRIGAIDKAWPVIRSVQTRLRGITGKVWKVTLQAKDKVTGTLKSIISKITSPLALLGAGTGLGAGIFFPLKLAGEFEQAQMSLDFYMGSVEKGKQAFQDLIRFAKETPFEFPFLQSSVIQLMGTGYNFEQAKRALTAFGDAAGRTGAGMEGIEAALLGFTQIASSGTLNLQDLRQVALNLRLPLNMFAKELGVAESELGDIGKAGISSQKAMEAIVRTLEQRFKGGMKELSNSLLGMTAVLKDTATLTVWHFGKGMAEPVKRIMYDIIGLTEDSGGKFEEFQKRLERAGERVGRKFEQMYERAKQFFSDLTNTPGFNEMTWSERVTLALDRILTTFNEWIKGPGGEMISATMKTMGELLATGIEEITPIIAPPAANLGFEIAKGILNGFVETIKSSPIGAFIMGALGGGAIGSVIRSVIPGAGTITFGAVGGVSGLVTWGISKVVDKFRSSEEVPRRAIGGIYSRPHTALVAEAGPEAIIPLSSRMRSRALGLYEETGRRLGVRPYAIGGFTGPVPITVPAVAGSSTPTSKTSISVTNYIDVSVGGSNASPDEIAEAIAVKLERVFQNMV